MNLDLINLDVSLEYEYESPCEIHTSEGTEYIPAIITITSVKCEGIEIITLVPKDELQVMEEKLLEERLNL